MQGASPTLLRAPVHDQDYLSSHPHHDDVTTNTLRPGGCGRDPDLLRLLLTADGDRPPDSFHVICELSWILAAWPRTERAC